MDNTIQTTPGINYANDAFPVSLVSSSSDPVFSSTASRASQPASGGDFQELLTTLLLVSTMGSLDSNSQSSSSPLSGKTGLSGFGGMGSSGNDILAPLMMLLFQNLLGNQGGTSEWNQSNYSTTKAIGQLQIPPSSGVRTQDFSENHIGIDTGTPVGTTVKSTMEGKVVFAGWNTEGYGNLVVIENGPYKTYYAHLSDFKVTAGQQVSAGSVIALSGNTGNSTGPHLHYELRVNGKPVDPDTYSISSTDINT
jgi:murein DD-endopeptidase MepM/ murein hydrolase activator NlpD